MNIFLLIALLSFMDVDTADEIIVSKDMSRAQRRHNTAVAVAKKRSRKTCRKGSGNWGFDPWWNNLDEEGKCEKPRLGNNQSGNKQHNQQRHRWDTYVYSHKRNTYKEVYESPEVELRKYFDKVDARAEKRDEFTDEEIERLWDNLSGEAERKEKEEHNKLVKAREKAEKELNKFKEEHKEVIEKYFELARAFNDACDAEYYSW